MFDRTLRKIIQKKLDEMLAPRSPMTADESMKTSPPASNPGDGTESGAETARGDGA